MDLRKCEELFDAIIESFESEHWVSQLMADKKQLMQILRADPIEATMAGMSMIVDLTESKEDVLAMDKFLLFGLLGITTAYASSQPNFQKVIDRFKKVKL